MISGQRQPAAACLVHEFTPYELKPLGGWTEFHDQLRAGAPLVRNLSGRGYYIPTRHEDILGVLQDPETFSSEAVVAYEPDPAYRWILHMINGEEHRQWRRQLGPYFAPRAIERIDARVRARACGLIEELAGRGSCDLMTDFALAIPMKPSGARSWHRSRKAVPGREDRAAARRPRGRPDHQVARHRDRRMPRRVWLDGAGSAEVEEWHTIIPDYRLGEGEPIVEFGRSSEGLHGIRVEYLDSELVAASLERLPSLTR